MTIDTNANGSVTVIATQPVKEFGVKVTVLGEQCLVGSAEVVSCSFGWELRVKTGAKASAYLATARVTEELPFKVGFDVIPDDWTFNPRSSAERAAAVWFVAETVEEAKALRNLSEVEWLSYPENLVQLALKPGYTRGDAKRMSQVAR